MEFEDLAKRFKPLMFSIEKRVEKGKFVWKWP